mmetsp:Transcript_34339/g.79276  ORF Transcript_34339/g.79276 Transcript_34339/m.79276 type:complete len:98 (+) Transcript_34339:213-506(+)
MSFGFTPGGTEILPFEQITVECCCLFRQFDGNRRRDLQWSMVGGYGMRTGTFVHSTVLFRVFVGSFCGAVNQKQVFWKSLSGMDGTGHWIWAQRLVG